MDKSVIGKLILFFLIPVQLLIFTSLVPPFQKPDEQAHFEQSLIISKGFVSCDKKSNNTMPIEKKYTDFIKTPYLDLLTHGKGKLPVSVFFSDLFSSKKDGKKINFNIDHLCSFPIVSYLPQALTLKIATLVNVNPIQSIYLVRLVMTILSYFWFLYLYKKINGSYKLILLFTFALPMTLHQLSSFSYDAFHIMFGLTFFMLIINENIGVINHTTTKYTKLFIVLLLFLASKKIGYETFFLFIFLIPFKIKPMMISSLIFIPFYILSKLSGSFDLQASLINTAINPLHQFNFLISNPLNILSILISTTVSRFTFYLQNLIGIFGWLEYGLDPFSYFLYGLFFIYVIVVTRHALSLTKNKKILLFTTLTLSYIFIVLLAFVFNTTPGQLTAHGVQGRYFIPFIPFIVLLIAQIKYYLGLNNFHKKTPFQVSPLLINVLSVITVTYLISATFFGVFNRYY